MSVAINRQGIPTWLIATRLTPLAMTDGGILNRILIVIASEAKQSTILGRQESLIATLVTLARNDVGIFYDSACFFGDAILVALLYAILIYVCANRPRPSLWS